MSILWLIGWLFTIGVLMADIEVNEAKFSIWQAMFTIVALIGAWPVYLGFVVACVPGVLREKETS